MKTYELTYIISSNASSDELNSIIKEIESFIQAREGVILKSEKTNAQTLAYPIRKQSSGYFITLEFQILENRIKEIKERLGKDLQILRHFVIIKKPIKEMKERRIRKPLYASISESIYSKIKGDDKKKTEKVEIDEINKKLDEILSE